MKPELVFTGNIRQCTKYDFHSRHSMSIGFEFSDGTSTPLAPMFQHGSIDEANELYKENAILIKVYERKGIIGYVDLDNLNSPLDSLKVNRMITKDGIILGGIVMTESAIEKGCLYIDEKSLKPYQPVRVCPKLCVKSKNSTIIIGKKSNFFLSIINLLYHDFLNFQRASKSLKTVGE